MRSNPFYRCLSVMLILFLALLAISASPIQTVFAQSGTPGINISPTNGLTTSEAGQTAAFDVTLTSMPNPGEEVSLSLESSETAEGLPDPQVINFDAANWSQPQTVVVTGVDDSFDDGDVAYTIRLQPASSDPSSPYAVLGAAEVSLTNLDDDAVGFIITPTSGLVTSESGQSDTFTVRLASQPLADVTINLESSNPQEGAVSPVSLTFTQANWQTAQTATVTGQDDVLFDGPQTYLVLTTANSSDPAYQSNPPDVSVENSDNDEQVTVSAAGDSFTTNQDVVLSVPAPGVLANDSTSGTILTAEIESSTTFGTLSLNSDGSFTYTPDPGYSGSDAFTYRARSGTVISGPTSVTLNVVKKETVTAEPDSYTLDMDQTLLQAAPGVLANDSTTGSYIVANLVSDVSHGTLTLNNNGSFTYKPAPGYSGTDSFVYKARTGSDFSIPVTVTLTINFVVKVNAQADSYTVNEGQTISQPAPGVLANDTTNDPPLSAELGANVSHGTLILNGDGSFSYTPTVGFSGIDSFTYAARSGQVLSAPVVVTLSVNQQNSPPIAVSDRYLTNATSTAPLFVPAPGVLSNDVDPENQPLTASVSAQPSSGSLVLNSNGSFTYTPAPGFNGLVSFTYQVTDAGAKTATASVDIEVDNVAPPKPTWQKPGENGSINNVTSGPVILQVSVDPSVTDVGQVIFYRWDPNLNQRVELGKRLSNPYAITIDSSTLLIGWNQIDAVVVDDAGNRSAMQHIWLVRSEEPNLNNLTPTIFMAFIVR